MHATLGEVLSLASCNRIVSSVGQQVEAFKSAPVEAPPPIILVDGMWVKIAYPSGEMTMDTQGRRRAVKRKEKRVMLSALGVWPDSHWGIVHWQLAQGENEPAWKAFFGQLYAKGLTEETTKLVVSDGAQGLEHALDYHFYGVPHQRCVFHKLTVRLFWKFISKNWKFSFEEQRTSNAVSISLWTTAHLAYKRPEKTIRKTSKCFNIRKYNRL